MHSNIYFYVQCLPEKNVTSASAAAHCLAITVVHTIDHRQLFEKYGFLEIEEYKVPIDE